MARAKAIAKVGLLSTREHNAPYVKVLTGLGFRVIELDGHCTSIPPSIKFCILRTSCVSHSTSDAAMAWARRSPATRVLAFCKGQGEVRAAGEAYKLLLLEEAAEKAVKTVKRRAALRPPTPTPTPTPTPPKESPMHYSQPANRALNSRETFLLETLKLMGPRGCGILDLAEKWEGHFSKWPSRSNVSGYVANLAGKGLIVNIAGAGNKGSTKDLKAAWYVHSDCVSRLSQGERELRLGTVIRARYDAHVTRMRASRWNRSVPPKATPKVKVTPFPAPEATRLPAPEVIKAALARYDRITPKAKVATKDSPMESIHTECELIVMWMREWNVKSLAISDKGVVELSCAPTKSPELKVTFRYDKP